VLDDRQYVYQASSDVNGGTVTVGYPYSLLEWCAEPHSSWSLPVDVRRCRAQQTAQEVGAAQIQALASALSRLSGSAGHLQRMASTAMPVPACGERVAVWDPGFGYVVIGFCVATPTCNRQKGSPRVHGARLPSKSQRLGYT